MLLLEDYSGEGSKLFVRKQGQLQAITIATNATASYKTTTGSNILRYNFDFIPKSGKFVWQVGKKVYELKDHLGNVRSLIKDYRAEHPTQTGVPIAALEHYAHYYPFGMMQPGRNGNGYRFGFNGMEMDDEMKGGGNSYDFGARIYDTRIGRWLSLDPLAGKYPEFSPYNFALNDPIYFLDPDGRDVIPTSDSKANNSINSLIQLASENSVFRKVMKTFYKDQNHVYVHLAQLKDDKGNPTGFTNTARAEPFKYKKNPVGKYGIHRIILNKDLLSADGELKVDKTFVFRALLHEGIHTRMFERVKQGNITGYPGHMDFLTRGDKDERHHNQMGAFNSQELVEGMKEFDKQLKEAGEDVPDYHTDDWYEAMSWYVLTRTQAWKDFKQDNPDKANEYTRLIKEQIIRNKKAIEEE